MGKAILTKNVTALKELDKLYIQFDANRIKNKER